MAAGCFQRDTLWVGKLMHQRASSRKIHLTWWQLVSIRENLIYLKTISLAISFRLNFAVLPGFNQREEEKATSLNLVREKLWSSQQGCLCKKNISLLVQIRLPDALLHFNENLKPCPRFSFAADGWGVWLHKKAHIFFRPFLLLAALLGALSQPLIIVLWWRLHSSSSGSRMRSSTGAGPWKNVFLAEGKGEFVSDANQTGREGRELWLFTKGS